jgi:DNA-binding PadR family transcriptional regulator
MEQAPLTEGVYLILLSLLVPRHGYAVMQNVEELTGGRVALGAGTLYGAINTLVEKGWISAVEENAASRKKEYIITPVGTVVLQHEIMRLGELLKIGLGEMEGKGNAN